MTFSKVNAILSNIFNLSLENNKAGNEEIQSLSLLLSQKINIKIKTPKINITLANIEVKLTMKKYSRYKMQIMIKI